MGVKFIPAQGLQDPQESATLARAFAGGWPQAVQSLRLGSEPDPETCWAAGAGWWLSTAPPEAA